MIPLDGPLRARYQNLWDTMVVQPQHVKEVNSIAMKIYGAKLNYTSIANEVKIPWCIVGIIHYMECDLDFSSNLANGDSIQRRTVNEPKGRPLGGEPPFSFNYCAIDALTYDRIINLTKDDIPRLLWALTKYNGFGYDKRGLNSPYIWGFTNHYTKGKYVADGKYDPEAVSKQIGCAPLLKKLL